MPTLKQYITASYGASTHNKTVKLKELKKNVAKTKNQFIFLQRCVKNKLIPKSLRIKCPVNNKRNKRIVEKYRFELLISTKNDAKHRFFNSLKEVKNIQDDLRLVLNNEDMIIVENVTEKSREMMFIRSKQRLIKKFEILCGQSKSNNNNDRQTLSYLKEPILNLVSEEIPPAHKEVLNLGPKFVPHTRKIPYMDIISTTESSALKLEYGKKVKEAQVLRRDVLRILKTAKPIKDNLTREQRTALKEIKDDPNISIYPFDKGTGLVRIRNEDAISKIREQIGETEIVSEDPTNSFARNIRTALGALNKKGRFTEKEYESIYPSDAIPPRMYGTVKAHKPEKNYPMRIVVSTIGSPPYGISSYLVKIIQPSLDKNKSRLKNSKTFVDEAKTWDITTSEIQVSYDVVNLYPSVPLKEATNVILDILSKDPELSKRTKLMIPEIKMILELCLSTCYFIWYDEIHILKDSGPIGLSVMVVLAEGFLQVLEGNAIEEALHQQPPIIPLSYYRYVDDSHSRFEDVDSPDMFLNILNKQHRNINYTIQKESDNKALQFLDINVINGGTGKYEFSIFRKNAITNVQVKPESSHNPDILRGVFKGFAYRAVSICSEKYVNEEINFLINVFVENGYKREQLEKMITEVRKRQEEQRQEIDTGDTNVATVSEIRQTITLPWIPGVSPRLKKVYRKAGYQVAFKSGKSIGTILTSRNKMRLPKNSYPGVYKIPCDCGKEPYRGETKKKISTRTKEHISYVEKREYAKSGIAQHSKNCQGIKFEDTETVAVIYNKFDRKVRETIEIQKHDCYIKNGGMNPDKGKYVTTTFWIPMLKYLKNSGQ